MEHDGFDDVEFRITEAPEPPPRRGRWVVAGVATLVATGMLAAGAWALTSPGSEPVPQRAPPEIHYNADGKFRCRTTVASAWRERAITSAPATTSASRP